MISAVSLPISVHGYFSNMHIDLNNSSNVYIFATFQFSARKRKKIILKLETFNVNDLSSSPLYERILRIQRNYILSYCEIKKFYAKRYCQRNAVKIHIPLINIKCIENYFSSRQQSSIDAINVHFNFSGRIERKKEKKRKPGAMCAG